MGGAWALLLWCVSAFGTVVGYSVVRFTAMKVFLWVLVITVFPVLISKGIFMLVEGVMSTMTDIDGTYGINSTIINFTGIAAWLAVHLHIVEGFSMLMSAITFRMAIRMIPFVRL